jgi:hypothetical protein
MEELVFLIAWPLVFLGLLTALVVARERRFRFSLPVMLAGLSLIAVWLGVVMALYHTRR